MVEVKASLLKRIGDSLSIHTTIPSPCPVAQSALRDIAHVHTMKDSSMHVVLSPQGCKLGEWLLYALVQRTTVHANIFSTS